MAEEPSVHELIEKRIDAYQNYLKLIRHPTQGMEKKGWTDEYGTYRKFTEEEIDAAEDQCHFMLDFYLDLQEAL